MSKFRDESNIETVKNACPICHADVKGNDVYKYFCSNCNILFRKDDLVITQEGINRILKEKVAEKFSKDPSVLKMDVEPMHYAELSDEKRELLKKHRESKQKPKKPARKKAKKSKSKVVK